MFLVLTLLSAVGLANAAMPTWSFERIDRASNGNRKIGLKLGADGRVHVAYTGCTDAKCEDAELMYAVRDGAGKWVTKSIDSTRDDTGWFPSLAIDAKGALHIAYSSHYGLKPALHYATLLPGSTRWSTRKVGGGRGGYWASLALRGDEVLVANTSFPKGDFNYPALQLARGGSRADDADWSFEELESGFDVGWFPSLAIDGEKRMAIAYSAGNYDHGRLMLQREQADGTWIPRMIDNRVVKNSLAFDAMGFAHLVYTKEDPVNTDLRDLVYATNFPSGEWTIETLDGAQSTVADTGYHPSLVIDAKGGLHALYYNRLQAKMMYARKLGAKWELAPARLDGQEGFYAAPEVDANGVVHVAIDTGDTIYYGRGVSE